MDSILISPNNSPFTAAAVHAELAESGEPIYKIGDRVDVRFEGGEQSFPGFIQRVNEDENTYDIRYEHDDVSGNGVEQIETGVETDFIKPWTSDTRIDFEFEELGLKVRSIVRTLRESTRAPPQN